jgi:hypothetical protein
MYMMIDSGFPDLADPETTQTIEVNFCAYVKRMDVQNALTTSPASSSESCKNQSFEI